MLQRDARLTWVKLAEAVNLSPSACQRRVEALQEQGVIERFTLSLMICPRTRRESLRCREH